MEPNMPVEQAREARLMHEKEAKDELEALLSADPEKVLPIRSIAQDNSRGGEKKTGEWNKIVLNESQGLSESSKLELPVTQYVHHTLDDDYDELWEVKNGAIKRVSEARRKKDPVPKASPDIDHPRIPSKRGPSFSDDGTRSLPFDNKNIPISAERSTLERPSKLPNLLPSPPPPFPIQHIDQLTSLQTLENIYAGAANSEDPSNNPNESAPSKIDTLAGAEYSQSAAEAEHTIHNEEANEPSTVDSDETENEEMKSTTSLSLSLYGEDDSDAILLEEEIHGTPSSEDIAEGSSRKLPIPLDHRFSARPSRKASRKASAAMAIVRKKNNKGRRRSGGPGPSGPAPPPTASGGGGGGGGGGPPGGHNETWGFSEGPGGPWVEPPVFNDPIFTRPSERRGLRKEVKEVISQLDWTDPYYDPHSPSKIRKQEAMYKLRQCRHGLQWPTSNVRGAVDWEGIQKARLGLAVQQAMRQNEDEEMADTQRDNGEGSSKSAAGRVMMTARDSGGEGSFTTMTGSDADSSDAEKSNDDDAATLVGQQSDDDRSIHSADVGIPRSFNGDFAQRLAAVREARRSKNRAFEYDASTAPQTRTTPSASYPLKQNYHPVPTTTNASSPAALREVASGMINNMDTIAASDSSTGRTTGDGGPVRMHDFEYDNLVTSGQIGGAADTREARPTPGPFVYEADGGARGGEAMPSSQENNNHNARITDLMARHLGLQLESPPPAGEPFPAMTGEWPQFPAGLMGDTPGPSEASRRGHGGTGDARRGSGPFGEDSSGSGQHGSSPRPE